MENDITDPRHTFASAKAKEVWENLASRKIPVLLNDIVKTLGVPVKESDLEIDGVSRMSSNGIFFIQYKKNIPEVRKRFTVAHELGHIVLEHISFDGSCSQYSNNSQEKEANTFANALLVPKDDLKSFLKNGGNTIENVTERYWVSKDTAIIAVNRNRLLNKIKIN